MKCFQDIDKKLLIYNGGFVDVSKSIWEKVMPYSIHKTLDIKYIAQHILIPRIDHELEKKFVMGNPLSKEDVSCFPTQLIITLDSDNNYTAPDVVGGAGRFKVSKRVKDIIEYHEPNVHTFFPLIASDQNGHSLPPYFFLYVSQSSDCFRYDKTSFIQGFGEAAAIKSRYMLADRSGRHHPCVLDKKSIADKFLWRGTISKGRKNYFCSDELGRVLIEEDITGWELGVATAE